MNNYSRLTNIPTYTSGRPIKRWFTLRTVIQYRTNSTPAEQNEVFHNQVSSSLSREGIFIFNAHFLGFGFLFSGGSPFSCQHFPLLHDEATQRAAATNYILSLKAMEVGKSVLSAHAKVSRNLRVVHRLPCPALCRHSYIPSQAHRYLHVITTRTLLPRCSRAPRK